MPVGKYLIFTSNLIVFFGAFYYDWSETHVFNPRWPGHAKFHNGQTMSIGFLLAVLNFYLLFVRNDDWVAALIGSIYTVAGLSAPFYPGVAWVDPEFKTKEGPERPQLWTFLAILAVNWIGYAVA